jgi:hypothetical protein
MEDSAVFYHIHHAHRELQFAPGVYTNDFAHWINEMLGESALAEKLANINIKDFNDLTVLKNKIVETVENYLNTATEIRRSPAGKEFYFCKSISVIHKTKYEAFDLDEFCEMLTRVGLRSIFFHFFEARLRLGRRRNDFSNWIQGNFEDEELANQIEALDPYLYTIDELRDKIIALVKRRQATPLGKVAQWLSTKLKITQK